MEDRPEDLEVIHRIAKLDSDRQVVPIDFLIRDAEKALDAAEALRCLVRDWRLFPAAVVTRALDRNHPRSAHRRSFRVPHY
jgi:ectoine hydroxylase-related dioxygenase (phytanoyl-CoA dioxygenase family)